MDVMQKDMPAGNTTNGAGGGALSQGPGGPVETPSAGKRGGSRWPMVVGAAVAVAVSGSLLVFGLNQQSAASDWKAKADTSAQVLETTRTDLTVARTESDAAKAERDTALGEASTVRADLGRITSQRDQMRAQLVAGKSVLAGLDDCIDDHDGLIAAFIDFINGVGTQAAMQNAINTHDTHCAAAYATAQQWFNAVSALGV